VKKPEGYQFVFRGRHTQGKALQNFLFCAPTLFQQGAAGHGIRKGERIFIQSERLFLDDDLNGKHNLKDLDIDSRILYRIFETQGVMM
jgi:hypothetical protein